MWSVAIKADVAFRLLYENGRSLSHFSMKIVGRNSPKSNSDYGGCYNYLQSHKKDHMLG